MTKKTIELADFERLSRTDQIQMLHEFGAYVGKRKEGGLYYVLLQLSGFYVEIRYKSYRVEIDSLHTSPSADMVNPYLDQIPVRDLDKNTDKHLEE